MHKRLIILALTVSMLFLLASCSGDNAYQEVMDYSSLPESEGLELSFDRDEEGYRVDGIGTCTDQVVVIPSSFHGKPIFEIGNEAFVECTNLTDVVIPDSVVKIGDSAFSGCTGLTNITLPDSVESLGRKTFSGCTNLQSVVMPDCYPVFGNNQNHNAQSSAYIFTGCSLSIKINGDSLYGWISEKGLADYEMFGYVPVFKQVNDLIATFSISKTISTIAIIVAIIIAAVTAILDLISLMRSGVLGVLIILLFGLDLIALPILIGGGLFMLFGGAGVVLYFILRIIRVCFTFKNS